MSSIPMPAVARPDYQKFDVAVKPSAIDGHGAFAAERIPARRKIGEIRGQSMSVEDARIRATRYERIMIVEVSERRAIDFAKSTDPLRFVNHCCAPNARLCIRQRRVEFHSLREIAPGEEITVDYGHSHHEGKLVCQCGAPTCKGRL
ncbi:SET domain-containing protein [Piscinibacter terrae]|uniref:SET domain-containing protein n=1 Tax=Piscinibacter terrae TaxID=2496871 RepID=A0A3N7HVE7_9BURK|nr:SET domain-containing protein-lysine N-methyltransferase [Albitalea terrae]RQP25823.1 SET domain-containing protein [Albitalea terrae]